MEKHHPFWKKNASFQYTYCFGLGVMSMGHMKSIMETQDFFEDILKAIRLPESQWQQIFFDLNNHFEEWVDKVFALLRGKEEQYCFTLDLYRILSHTVWSGEYCSAVLEDYLQVFQFSHAERAFFREFDKCMRTQDEQGAIEAVQKFSEEGYSIRYDFLTWFYPQFYMEKRYPGIRIRDGETVVLDCPTIIRGDIEVDKGGSLLIHGADMQMDGRVIVHGGRLQADHGHIEITECTSDYWLSIEGAAVVMLTDTSVDCKEKCGLLEQKTGYLLVNDCWVRQTAGARAISFEGDAIRIHNTHFSRCMNGMVSIQGGASAEIVNCEFQEGIAEYGGAVYADTIHDVLLEHCTVRSCQAKYLAAAVYFKFQKLGQRVEDCQCIDCDPPENVFFNIL